MYVTLIFLLDSAALDDDFLPHLSTCFHLPSKFVRITYVLITPTPVLFADMDLFSTFLYLLFTRILSHLGWRG